MLDSIHKVQCPKSNMIDDNWHDFSRLAQFFPVLALTKKENEPTPNINRRTAYHQPIRIRQSYRRYSNYNFKNIFSNKNFTSYHPDDENQENLNFTFKYHLIEKYHLKISSLTATWIYHNVAAECGVTAVKIIAGATLRIYVGSSLSILVRIWGPA